MATNTLCKPLVFGIGRILHNQESAPGILLMSSSLSGKINFIPPQQKQKNRKTQVPVSLLLILAPG